MKAAQVLKSLSQTSLNLSQTNSKNHNEPEEESDGNVKLQTFSTNADVSLELESHPLLLKLKNCSPEFIQGAISNKNVSHIVIEKNL